MENDGMSLVLGGGAIGALCTLGAAWIKARYARTKVEPTPLEVAAAPRLVTCEACDRRHAEVDRRLDRHEDDLRAVLGKLDQIESNNENRAKRLHDRLDPVVRAVAANQELLRNHLEDHRTCETRH